MKNKDSCGLLCSLDFYKGKRVLITGHTGFKGSWLCYLLIKAGALVSGYALEPPTNPSLFEITGIDKKMNSIIGDIRDLEKLKKIFEEVQPEIVFHLAAQPIVREAYSNPVYTYETNVMGTVNICECIRLNSCVRSFVNITTDKVYRNNEWIWGYREDDILDGHDPYSNSKSCSELVTHCYKQSYFDSHEVAVSTVRAGNVIGGGDFAKDRIIPDCIRAINKGESIVVRNPYSTRPFQHVLEPLSVYLMIAAKQYEDKKYQGYYNVGPKEEDCITTKELVTIFCEKWGGGVTWKDISEKNAPREASFLKLDCSKLKNTFGWKPRWSIEKAIEKVVDWTKGYLKGEDVLAEMDREIEEFFN